MPYVDRNQKRYHDRVYTRDKRHPGWRQVYVDCQGMCQGIHDDGEICGDTDGLEYHEIFGEDHNGDGRMQQRILLCNLCHSLEHQKRNFVQERHYPSMLQQDISYEIEQAGSVQLWVDKYELLDNSELIAEAGGYRHWIDDILKHEEVKYASAIT